MHQSFATQNTPGPGNSRQLITGIYLFSLQVPGGPCLIVETNVQSNPRQKPTFPGVMAASLLVILTATQKPL